MKLKDYKEPIILSIDNSDLGELNDTDKLLVIRSVSDSLPSNYAKKSILKCFELSLDIAFDRCDPIYNVSKEQFDKIKLGSVVEARFIYLDYAQEEEGSKDMCWYIDEESEEEYHIFCIGNSFAIGYRHSEFIEEYVTFALFGLQK